MMWIAEAGPQEKRFVCGLQIEEGIDLVRDIVVCAGIQEIDAVIKRLQIIFFVDLSERRGRVGGAIKVEAATADTGEVPSFGAKQFGKGDFAARQWGRKAGHTCGDGGFAGHQAGARGHTLRGAGKEAMELHAFCGQLIEHRRPDAGISVGAEEGVAVIVTEQQQKIRSGGRLVSAGSGIGDDKKCAEHNQGRAEAERDTVPWF